MWRSGKSKSLSRAWKWQEGKGTCGLHIDVMKLVRLIADSRSMNALQGVMWRFL